MSAGITLFQTVASLYAEGKISAGMGAKLLACDRWEFYRLLSERGFSVIDYAEDESYETQTSRELAMSSIANGIQQKP